MAVLVLILHYIEILFIQAFPSQVVKQKQGFPDYKLVFCGKWKKKKALICISVHCTTEHLTWIKTT